MRAEGGYIIWWPAHGLGVHGRTMQLRPPPGWLLALLPWGEAGEPDAVSDAVFPPFEHAPVTSIMPMTAAIKVVRFFIYDKPLSLRINCQLPD